MNSYFEKWNNYVKTHKLKIGWHLADKAEQTKIVVSRKRNDDSRTDPLTIWTEDLLLYVADAMKQEARKQKLSPEAIFHKIGKEICDAIRKCIKSQGITTFRGHTIIVPFPKLKQSTIQRKRRKNAPYVEQRLMEFGSLMNSVGYSIV